MKQKFTIFFTGDIHGRDRQSAKLFSLYKEKRKEAEELGNICFFFDSGDSADRSVEYCGLTKCRAYSHILNVMAYDAQTVGNDIGLVYGPGILPFCQTSSKQSESRSFFKRYIDRFYKERTEYLFGDSCSLEFHR